MSKVKLFIENFLVYGLGGIISKIIPFIMIPIITRIMPSTEYFGLNDLSETIVSFASALAILGMYDAMFRMFFEKDEEEYKKTICSTTLLFTVTTSFIIFLIMLLLKNVIADIFFQNRNYSYLIFIIAFATLVGATNGIISAPTRMQNKRKVFLVTNTISPVLSYAVSLPLLIKGYYVIALPLAGVITGVTMEISFWFLNRKWFNVTKFDFGFLKQLLKIAIPLVPNFLVYWIFNSSDRLMIVNLLDIGSAGVYSVGSKLGHASQLIYTAFAGGWQYFAFSTMKEENQVKSNSITFEYLGLISFICTMIVCTVAHPLYEILFPKEYVIGYIISPYLFLAPLLQMLFQVAANQFLVVKKTWPNMLILSTGAILNVVLNLILIPRIGIEGAAIATLAGYFIADIVCIAVLCKMKLMEIRFQFIIVVLLTFFFMIIWRFFFSERFIYSILLSSFMILLFVLIYLKDLKLILSRTKEKIREL